MKPIQFGLPISLTILFIGLKLGHAITWSWVWVLSPIWISLSIYLALAVVIVFYAGNKGWK